jgi:dihydropteroate synthase
MSVQDTDFYAKIEQLFNQKSSPLVMGILNITPDSFYDGGNYLSETNYLAQTEKMILEGADIIDIGAYSTRPGAEDISEEEELKRIVPVISVIKNKFPKTIISVDTFRANIAEKAVSAGASIINDISGGQFDNNMFATVAKLQVPYVLMHIKGTPKTMQVNPEYNNVTDEVLTYFEERINELKKLGFQKIILDPGFGFGKTIEHSYQLLTDLEKFNELRYPVLVGVSRKSMIHKVLNTTAQNALNGTTVLNTIAIQKGAKILRVHDVKEANEVVKLCAYLT